MRTAIIEVRGLRILARHGAYPQERERDQPFVLDLTIGADIGRAVQTDELIDTVCYAEVVAEVTRAFTHKRMNLIEHAAAEVTGAVLAKFPAVSHVKVTVSKPQAPLEAVFETVAVTIEERRDG